MIILDTAKLQIFNEIASHTPERGGALYGPRDYPVVTHFEFDKDAETTAVTYVPSLNLIANVKAVEKNTGLEFKGIIHSHPNGFTQPSQGDKVAVESFFNKNPHFAKIDLPIIQQSTDYRQEFIHWYHAKKIGHQSARRSLAFKGKEIYFDSNSVGIYPVEYHALPLYEDCSKIANELKASGLNFKITKNTQNLRIKNAMLFGLIATCETPSENFEFIYFITSDYPVVAPVIFYQQNGNTHQLDFEWDGNNKYTEGLINISEKLRDNFLNQKTGEKDVIRS